MREPTPVEQRTPELQTMYERLEVLSGLLAEIAVRRVALEDEWHVTVNERIQLGMDIRSYEDGNKPREF